ncbi:MAG: hypothetical protein J1E63_03705 [Muribaculaceae bacterium]|nr:hypothetical protein [Muribaculaceae bacterium]
MKMSNMNDNITKTINWVNEYVQDKALVLKEDNTVCRLLPLSISAPYQFLSGTFSGISILWVLLKHYEDIVPSIIKRHSEIISKASGLIPIFVIEKIESYKIQRLAKACVNFIIKDKVIYLPDLLFIVRNHPKIDVPIDKEIDKIPALSQLMVLYHIQKHTLNGLSTKQIADTFNVSYATAIRGIVWLMDKGVLSQTGKKEKLVKFNYDGKALWEFCANSFRNPIESLHQTDEIERVENFSTAGEAALGRYTMLSEHAMTIAISKKTLSRMNKQSKGWDKYGDLKVQTWIYDPELMADGDVVDRLSLYLSLKDYHDERVQIELENMINEIKW